METTAMIHRATGWSTHPATVAALSFMHEYVFWNTRFATIHTRHQPLLEPGNPAQPKVR